MVYKEKKYYKSNHSKRKVIIDSRHIQLDIKILGHKENILKRKLIFLIW